jgi:predicted lipid-binding transport protein (Tim44 family)
MCIEESKEDEVEDQHFVEAWTMQKDTREENVVLKE